MNDIDKKEFWEEVLSDYNKSCYTYLCSSSKNFSCMWSDDVTRELIKDKALMFLNESKIIGYEVGINYLFNFNNMNIKCMTSVRVRTEFLKFMIQVTA